MNYKKNEENHTIFVKLLFHVSLYKMQNNNGLCFIGEQDYYLM